MSTKAIGIDFGGTSVKSAIVDDGRITQRGNPVDTRKHTADGTLFDAIFEAIAMLRLSHPDVRGVGMGLPGFVDTDRGVVHGLSNVPGWDNVPMLGMLCERTGLPCAIENDANAMAFAEFMHGAAQGAKNAICITLGTGVGGGLILDGRLYRGSRYAAGELGHSSVDMHGPRGVYGTPGDLEVYVGNRQIGERASRLYAAAQQERPPEQCTPKDLEKLARAGDHIAIALWDSMGDEIGAALTNAIWLLNPDTIVIGGGVAAAGDLLFDPIRRSIRGRTSTLFSEHLRVLPAKLGNDAGIIGCAALALAAAK
jgi:glucokinase